MRGPSLQKATLVSGALHLMFFLMALLVMRQSGRIIIPSPYVVSLVDPRGIPSSPRPGAPEAVEAKAATKEITMAQPPDAMPRKNQSLEEEQRFNDRISELASKKKIERIVKLRSIISLKGREEPAGQQQASKGTPTGTQQGGSAQGTLFDSYYAKITDEIRREWIFPDAGAKNLQAVVFVKVARDGSLAVQGIEKSSGNLLFDRSALKAIAKASPVSAPPYEMEIGIRFTP